LPTAAGARVVAREWVVSEKGSAFDVAFQVLFQVAFQVDPS
jgi:hypothetical protein